MRFLFLTLSEPILWHASDRQAILSPYNVCDVFVKRQLSPVRGWTFANVVHA